MQVFIDADNISYKLFNNIKSELINFPDEIQSINVYADWSKSETNNWIEVCKNNGLNPIMATRYVKLKESSDMKIAVDIMQTLYELQHVNTYVIVSNDTDFIQIVNTLKKKGKRVIGIGSANKNKILKDSYNNFISIDKLSKRFYKRRDKKRVNKDKKIKMEEDIYNKSIEIIELAFDTRNSFNATFINDKLKKFYPSFDWRNYGYTKYANFISNYYSNYNISCKGAHVLFLNN